MSVAVTQAVRIAVIGASGHGKSTFLNAIVACQDDDLGEATEEFEVAATTDSCTKKVGEKTLLMPRYTLGSNGHPEEQEGQKVRVTLVDTMGFPDPDKNDAAKFYDDVVNEAINNPNGLSALVWVVANSRASDELYAQYDAFLNELSQANCSFIMVVNGMISYPPNVKSKPATLAAARKTNQDLFRQSAVEIIQFVGLDKMPGTDQKRRIPIIASSDMDWLYSDMPSNLMAFLDGLECKKSKVKTFKELQDAYSTLEKALETQTKQAAENQTRILGELQHTAELLRKSNYVAAQSAEKQKQLMKQSGIKQQEAQDAAAAKAKAQADKRCEEQSKEDQIKALEIEIAVAASTGLTTAVAGIALAVVTFGVSAAVSTTIGVAATTDVFRATKLLDDVKGTEVGKVFDEQMQREAQKEGAAKNEARDLAKQAGQAEQHRKEAEQDVEQGKAREETKREEQRQQKEKDDEKKKLLAADANAAFGRMQKLAKYLVSTDEEAS